MLKCHLSSLMGQKKVNISQVARATGLNRSTVSHLYHETAVRVELEALDRLCRHFNCGVGDLLEYQSPTASVVATNGATE